MTDILVQEEHTTMESNRRTAINYAITEHGDGISENGVGPSKQEKERKKGSCCNCSRKLRTYRFCKLSFSRFYISIVATAIIQFMIFCICIFDPKIGVYVPEESLPTLNDCGSIKLKPSVPIFGLLVFLNLIQIIFDLWATAVTFLFARQMSFRMVILRYIFTTLVRARIWCFRCDRVISSLRWLQQPKLC